jgi:hypothetical protein
MNTDYTDFYDKKIKMRAGTAKFLSPDLKAVLNVVVIFLRGRTTLQNP